MDQLSYYAWVEEYQEELDCELAEIGASSDADFCMDNWLENKYEEYLKGL